METETEIAATGPDEAASTWDALVCGYQHELLRTQPVHGLSHDNPNRYELSAALAAKDVGRVRRVCDRLGLELRRTQGVLDVEPDDDINVRLFR